MTHPMEHTRILITGIVQGVGMRPHIYREALAHGILGTVNNAVDGVHIDAYAEPDRLDSFVHSCASHAPAAAHIEDISIESLGEPGSVPRDFRIIQSDGASGKATLVSPDIATCEDCLRELFDSADRRYHYPFINCTNCGPRFTIIRSLPYDRPATSMDAFPMCAACAAEYADPLDRRFHAQPNACFTCGPHITWQEHPGAQAPRIGSTREESDAIIERCAELLGSGGIVAIKGIGGFHLACNAADGNAVEELRRRKRRSNKPFAVMVPSIANARLLCHIDAEEESLLMGSVRPIVLLRKRTDEARPRIIADGVARGLPELGVMLPYTPLQHLLMAACRDVDIPALVMTSGNISEEPIETDDGTAWERLGGIADALLGNDRPILSRYDDSVVRVLDGSTLPVRRARGIAPSPLPLPALAQTGHAPDCILACGAQQKATLALTREGDEGAQCFLSQHIGDVENASTLDAWHEARRRLETLFGLAPGALVCDAHPTYLTSQWARAEHGRTGLPLLEVQHHHAHIASVIAEAASKGAIGPADRVIGIALDGTGAGDDGTIWGGEVLVCDLSGYRRAAHLRPWRLPGGAASIRDARRCALSLLQELSLLEHPGARPLLAQVDSQTRAVTERMVERGLNSPLTSSMGRLFDAASALLGICGAATYEGEPACLLESAATHAGSPERLSPLDMDGGSPILDTEPLVRHLLDGIAGGQDAGGLALAFHLQAAQLFCRAAERIRSQEGIGVVALSGGVFLNRIMLSQMTRLLEKRGFTVLVPTTVPVNDGCIAYGQSAVARAVLAQR